MRRPRRRVESRGRQSPSGEKACLGPHDAGIARKKTAHKRIGEVDGDVRRGDVEGDAAAEAVRNLRFPRFLQLFHVSLAAEEAERDNVGIVLRLLVGHQGLRKSVQEPADFVSEGSEGSQRRHGVQRGR